MMSFLSVKLSLELLALFILYNYTTTLMASVYDQLTGMDYSDEEGNPEGWFPMMLVVMIQKFCVVCISFSCLLVCNALTQKSNKVRLEKLPTSEHEDNESDNLNGSNNCSNDQADTSNTHENKIQEFKIRTQDEWILGFLLFLSIAMFSYLQSAINIIYVLVQKSISCWILYLTVASSTGKLFSWSKLLPFLCFSAVIVFSTIVKIAFNEVEGFYSSQLGAILEQVSVEGCLGCIGMIALDFLLYRMLWKINDYSMGSVSNRIRRLPQTFPSLHKTFHIMYSTTKYCFVIMVVFSLVQGELIPSFRFIRQHKQLVEIFIKLGVVHFFNQILLFYTLSKFNLQVMMVLLLTNGTFAKMGFFFTKAIDIHTIIFVFLLLSVILSVKNVINHSTAVRTKNS